MSSVAFVCLSVCLSVCVSVCNALTFKSVDLESSFSACKCIFGMPRSCLYVKVTGTKKLFCSQVVCLRMKSNIISIVVKGLLYKVNRF